MSNELRMPFAEWLYRMKQSDLPPQAMMLAVGAVFFKVTSNEQLARMVNMDTRGIADKTYNKWKYQLSRDGWVIIRQITVGRRTTIEVHPAYKESPVKFTSFRAIDPATLLDAPSVKTTDETEIEPATITSENRKSYGTRPVETTGEERNDYDPAVGITAEAKESSPHTPLKENNTFNKLASNTTPREELAGLNGSSEPMIEDIIGWMTGGDRQSARNWLTTFLRQYPQEIVRQSYFKLKTDLADGKLVSRPLQAWAGIAARLKAEPRAKANGHANGAAAAEGERKSTSQILREEYEKLKREEKR